MKKKYNVSIPQQFRNLILNYGIKVIGCDPHYYTLDELNEWAYTDFIDLYQEHKYEWKTDDGINPFPLGVFGGSSEAFIDTNTGKVYMFYYEDEIEYLKEDVYSLLNMQIGIEIDLMKNYL